MHSPTYDDDDEERVVFSDQQLGQRPLLLIIFFFISTIKNHSNFFSSGTSFFCRNLYNLKSRYGNKMLIVSFERNGSFS